MFTYIYIYIHTHAHTLMSMETCSLYFINAFFSEYGAHTVNFRLFLAIVTGRARLQ